MQQPLQQQRDAFSSSYRSLAGWREENYAVGGGGRTLRPLFEMERAATPILGVRQYGIHINGMVEVGGNNTTTTSLWLQVRSRTKQTFPGKLGTDVQLPVLRFADPGCLSRILIFIHPGSRIQQQHQKRGEKLLIPFLQSQIS
jgi:hypothetical protein